MYIKIKKFKTMKKNLNLL